MDIVTQLNADRAAARPYEEQGYVVTIEPPASAIPACLGGYRPNVLAVKGGEHIMIDVKQGGTRPDDETYFRLMKLVAQHPGWRLMITSFNDEYMHDDARTQRAATRIDVLRRQLTKFIALASDREMAELVLPRLWLIYMEALRAYSAQEQLPADHLSDISCLNQAYEMGLVFLEEYEGGRHMLILRNKLITTLGATAAPADCENLRHLTVSLLDKITSREPVL